MFKISPKRALAAGAVSALAVTGVSAALWTDKVDLNTTVNTGSLNVAYQQNPEVYEVGAHAVHFDDPYAQCTAAVSPDGKTLSVTINGAYPGYKCQIFPIVKNTGTTPARVTGVHDTNDNSNIIAGGANVQYVVQQQTVIEPGATNNLGGYLLLTIDPNADNTTFVQNAVAHFSRTFTFENA